MCGRFGVTTPPWQYAKRIDARVDREATFLPRYNVAPTQQVIAVTNDEQRSLVELRWGLVPFWAKEPASVKLSTFNARIETIAIAPTYREPTRARRCVIVADGFYEWRKNADGTKTPLWIHRADGGLFGFAGLWDVWRSKDQRLSSCTIITGPANDFMAPAHSRMPIVLDYDRTLEWLRPDSLDPRSALEILLPAESASDWVMQAVSARVGNVRNDDPTLIAPVLVGAILIGRLRRDRGMSVARPTALGNPFVVGLSRTLARKRSHDTESGLQERYRSAIRLLSSSCTRLRTPRVPAT